MSQRSRHLPLVLAAALIGCTNADLQAIDDVEINLVDNLLEIEGEVCTDPPEATDFPVKIMFLIDGSGSMQFVDNPTRRALAVEEVILRLRANPSVSFSVIRFNESDVVLTKPGASVTADDPLGVDLSGAFTRDPAILQQAVQGLRVADSVTDYQGALATAFQILASDMLDAPPAELGRTKYVLLFLSDGDPFPDCCSRMSEASGLCTRAANIPFCEDPDQIRANPTQLPWLVAGEDYNQPFQIRAAVQDIMDLAETFNVGELRMHTAFLFDPSLVGMLDANGCYSLGGGITLVCPDEARSLLGMMAALGDGVFRDFSAAEEIDFLGFDLLNIKRENAMKNLIVHNANVIPTPDGLAVDSDGDGLSDDLEFENGLNRLSRDTDDDGFSDTLEWKFRRNGFDPEQPSPGCELDSDRTDLDADGLLRCEEVILGTSTDIFDTDADGVPDGLELIAGSDPALSDALADSDLDGVRNGDEIRVHTGIGFGEASRRPQLAYRYRTDELGTNDEGGQCYSFRVRNVQLETPLARTGERGSFGRNDLFVYMAQAPFDDPNDFGSYKVACINARYVAPDFKDPPTGVVQLTPENFWAPDELDVSRDCVGLTPPPGVAQ
ncbi:MAG: VWA domain-containing protein [Deltaproteobacteria bacterium]